MNLFSALILIAATGLAVDTPTNYKTAYKKAQTGDKPLLVLVTAEWCPPCKVMKATTIPTLLNKDAFKEFHYSTVDFDHEKTLATQLIGDRGLPQLIMFEKRNEKWVRRYLTGIQSPETVEAFVAQAKTIRISKVEPVTNEPAKTAKK